MCMSKEKEDTFCSYQSHISEKLLASSAIFICEIFRGSKDLTKKGRRGEEGEGEARREGRRGRGQSGWMMKGVAERKSRKKRRVNRGYRKKA